MGHSMGCSVIWGLYDLHGPDRIGKLVLVDQPASLSQNGTLTPEEQAQAGAIFPAGAAFEIAAGLAGEAGEATTDALLATMISAGAPEAFKAQVRAANLKMPRKLSAQLVLDHVFNDWRDVLPRIALPTLCVGAEGSNVPPDCMRWAASVIPGAEVEIFPADEGGSHFMFMENPERFNRRLRAFLDA